MNERHDRDNWFSGGESKNVNGKKAAPTNRSSLPSNILSSGSDPLLASWKFVANLVTGGGRLTGPMDTHPNRTGIRTQFTFFAYALAVMTVACAVVATLKLGPVVKHTPTLFFCSVVLSSWFGGLGPGIFAGLLSAIALDYYFIPPIYALGISLEDAPDMIVFLSSSVFVSWLNRDRKKDSARNGRNELDAKVRERTVELVQTGNGSQEEIPEYKIQGRAALAQSPTLRAGQKSMFFRQGDYWTIEYQGHIVHLKATRGLGCLASLLSHPGREFHVSELFAPAAELPVAVVDLKTGTFKDDGNPTRARRFQDAGPILDVRAKGEYTRRLADLRDELEEAERLNDPERARKVRSERDCLADQLALAAGLGGRNRKAASQAERARSAVTKRIRDSIRKIGEAIPPLGRHLANRIKTGYFCCYNPNPDHPAVWEVRF